MKEHQLVASAIWKANLSAQRGVPQRAVLHSNKILKDALLYNDTLIEHQSNNSTQYNFWFGKVSFSVVTSKTIIMEESS